MLAFSFLTNCSVKTPEVTVTGEKTALENQVIGTYEKIEEETWVVASVRSNQSQGQRKISPEQKRVLDAVQNRKFNKDEISEFKQNGFIGENIRGLLELRPVLVLNEDAELKKQVETLIQEENLDREVVMNRVIEINPEAAKADREKIFAIFAQMNRDNEVPGHWIQLASGEWVKKEKATE
jgi:uncharacterized protein YdbL (DUF1318 family)